MNDVLLSVVLAVVVAQFIKTLLVFHMRGRFIPSFMWETGSMPSAHSAAVSALAVSIFMTEGVSSLFVLSLVFAAVTLRDAMGVRHSVGEHAKILNTLLEEPLKVREGHTPLQVFAGFCLGVACSLLAFFL